ncbi:uncharacterized protein PSFLO_06655 [Pseudozyma flocculosa]|uniref:Secreted protein n=1 Tax=Pseudozyma flocculosa TaxID=84751 RepID=A0A5C3F9P6_9BASI|nr:uncharacterized protein PSFLO_06655 [Pseudozyma flocculosa]
MGLLRGFYATVWLPLRAAILSLRCCRPMRHAPTLVVFAGHRRRPAWPYPVEHLPIIVSPLPLRRGVITNSIIVLASQPTGHRGCETGIGPHLDDIAWVAGPVGS